MKKTSCTIVVLILALKLLSQQTTPNPTVDYLAKSKKQKTTAWLLLGGGFLVNGITALGNTGVCIGPGCTKKKFPIVPVAIGGAAMVSSVPFFIAASKNKRKAAAVSLKLETVPLPGKQGLAASSVPSLSLVVTL